MSIDKGASYYDAGGIETMDYLRAKLTPEQFKGFLLGSLLKYPSRSNFKGCFRRDIEKSGIYSKLLLELPEQEPCDLCSYYGDLERGKFKFCPDCGKKLIEVVLL